MSGSLSDRAAIVKKATEVRRDYLAQAQQTQSHAALDVMYILTTENSPWLDERDISMAVDMEIARRSAVFVGNGMIYQRLIDQRDPIAIRFKTGSQNAVHTQHFPPNTDCTRYECLSCLHVALCFRHASHAFSITDFQGRMVDLTDGNPQPFTPVQSFTPANTTNQQWALISSMDARQLWEVANVGGNSILSHTTALLAKPGPAIHSQIGNRSMARFTDADTGLALTAWLAVGNYPSSPIAHP
ncbi:hypothetical protein FB451DRAFT_1413058 [Mycena latifolia]|nr:hypothetical protein FB451DRAFT_1413058 [Mycena latifolia]